MLGSPHLETIIKNPLRPIVHITIDLLRNISRTNKIFNSSFDEIEYRTEIGVLGWGCLGEV
jgi:hypothetical protein